MTDIANAPAIHDLELITAVKSFLVQTPFHSCKENFSINAKRQHFCHFICQLKIKHSIEQPKTVFFHHFNCPEAVCLGVQVNQRLYFPLSTMNFPLLAWYQQAGRWRKAAEAESTLMLAESGAVILP